MDARERPVLDDDDRLVGRVLSRREMLALFGATGATVVAASMGQRALGQEPDASAPLGSTSPAADVPSCIVRPELTEGPYFVDAQLMRSDIRTDPATGAVSDGLPLALTFLVSAVEGSTCAALPGALVDVWHCDAQGVYSGVSDPGLDTTAQAFLRGSQLTDATGSASFVTIFPGWYRGRAVHIHFKLRTDPGEASGLEFTSQLFFTDEATADAYATPAYAARGTQDTPNSADFIFADGGDQLLLDLRPTNDGFTAVFPIGIQLI
jgi:protocatechuate 3,4-dioxygenase beta subunit